MKAIDLTPTWEQMVEPMADLYAQHQNKIKSSFSVSFPKTQQAIEGRSKILAEFKKMAKAADLWNESQKTNNK